MNLFRTRKPGRWLAPVLAGLLALASCGGGVGEGGTGGGAAYTQGAINGFGSVIVNDVRYDDSSASVQDADGNGKSSADLRLGMTVAINSTAVTSTTTGLVSSATGIRYGSELVGPLAAIDLVNGRLTLLGQSVQVGVTTVFDDRLASGLASLVSGQLVEIYAAYDAASGRYLATRVEPRSSASTYTLRGPVSALDSAARSFKVGSASFGYASDVSPPSGLANGQFVRVQLQATAANSSRWTVLSFAGNATPVPADGLDVKLKGLITSFSSATDFNVNGQRIDASGASFPNGSASLGLGVRVEVEGKARAGVLNASKVAIKTDSEENSRSFELKGNITALASATKTFVLRGVTVGYARSDLVVKNGKLADLAVGKKVEIKGVLGSGGATVDATEIAFDD